MSASNRILKLEQRPQPQRPHGMTQDDALRYMGNLAPAELGAFIKSMTDDDLSASFTYLQTLTEQSHATTYQTNRSP